MMIFLNFFGKTCAWLMTLMMFGSWQVRIGGRMWKAWHTLLGGSPLDEAVAYEPALYSPTSLFKCDGCSPILALATSVVIGGQDQRP